MEITETKKCFNPYYLQVLNCPDYVSVGTQANSILRQMVLAYLTCVLQEDQSAENETGEIMKRISKQNPNINWDASYCRFAVSPIYDDSAAPNLKGFKFTILYNPKYLPDDEDNQKLRAGTEAVEKVLSEQMEAAS